MQGPLTGGTTLLQSRVTLRLNGIDKGVQPIVNLVGSRANY